jgi:hypothetical protein
MRKALVEGNVISWFGRGRMDTGVEWKGLTKLGERGGDWGKSKNLIPKRGKDKVSIPANSLSLSDVKACPPFLW